MKKVITLTCLVFLMILTIPSGVLAQNRTITGTVVEAETQTPLPGVSVVVQGTTKGTMTNAEGKFSLDATEGQILQFSFIGYASKEFTVGKSNTINVEMQTDVQAIDEVMVTAEFGMKRVARSVGSSIQNIKAADISDSGRESFISALQGRVAGLNVSSSGGTPGSSTTVVLRSITSISGNNQPLYVVDGIPMNNSTFDPLSLADGGANFSVRNLDFSSRGNDFNPEDIESMTVLKGAAAAALYGSDASNGAIIITTKKGTAGTARVSYSNAFKWDKAYGYPDMQTKYANGAYGTTNYYYTSRYGGLYPEGMQLYDNIDAVLRTGFSAKHNVSIEGGSEKASVRASASFLDQQGIVKTTDYSRMNVSLAGKGKISKWLSFEGSMQLVSTENTKVPRGTSGPLYQAMLWPLVDDMSNYLSPDGSHMRNPDYYTDTDLLNPLFGMYKNKLYDDSDRFISSFAFSITPVKDAFVRAQVGWDVGTSTYETSIHPYYYDNNGGVGQYNLAKSNFSYPTLNFLAGYNKTFLDKFYVSTQFGYHQIENGVTRLATYGSNYAVIDFHSINNVDPSTVASTKTTTTRRIQALSGQIELAYNNMAFVTLRARNDWSSTLPKDNNSYFYPAIEGAFIVSELPFIKEFNPISYLKLRGSIAQVGKDAGPLEIDPQLQATELTGGGYRYGFTGPNKDLRPEMTTSHEIGFEGRFLGDRINADFTYFWTHCEDQIVKGFRLSYATGFVLNNMNVGTFETQGWEAHVDADIIRTKSGLTWNVGVNASHTSSEVVYLPENVTEYYNPYTWNSGNIRNGIMVGQPVTTLTGRAYSRNDAGQILIDPTTGLPVIDPTWSVIGDREPKLRFGFTTRVNYKGFSLTALLAGRYKATVVNGTKRLMMQRGTSWESVNLREQGPVVFDGVLQDGNENTTNPTSNNISVTYDVYGSSIYSGYDEDWLEKNVNYFRLQELRLSYRIPTRILQKTFISRAVVYVAGNDLATWTNYSGIDAVGNTVSAAAGGTGGEGYDVWSIPNPRGYSIGVNITFK
ncbi:SusC/RagA family TonB-linked outer membrane protein [Maribellus luteus]|uniref:SusC/RagA family TonB-linked outer membrane protein n=1 Tax=Maribellus luteus TaxID=2305463 RepID=A0A399SVL8_9BACT|nr:SusC/RagA family TonB-linked outer membrane protein [Maribellus luteus]RIJ46351.1 SusC/RagA family TonB-linked outer membrane protein [Maribellus luteus]